MVWLPENNKNAAVTALGIVDRLFAGRSAVACRIAQKRVFLVDYVCYRSCHRQYGVQFVAQFRACMLSKGESLACNGLSSPYDALMADNSENDDDNDYDDANDDNHLVRTGDGPVQKGLFENTVADLSTTSRPVIYFKIFVFRCCRQATLASLRDAGTDSNKAEKNENE